jgi:hypothetical protein
MIRGIPFRGENGLVLLGTALVVPVKLYSGIDFPPTAP